MINKLSIRWPFGKHQEDKIRNNIKLVSVHIPKTAGTSFRNTLKEVYGEEPVIRLDIGLGSEKIKINEQPFAEKRLSKKYQVAHGHFSPALLQKYFEIADNTPFITWLRDPVERVISNYFYLEKRLKEELQEQARGLNILSKMQRSLPEYARVEINRNRMSKFLKGRPLEDFLFVGLVEHYSEDLAQLAQILNWESFQEKRHNVTGGTIRNEVSEAIREEIKQLNEEDVRLYEQALQLRQKI